MENLEEKIHSAYVAVWESLSLWKYNTANIKSTDPLQRTCSMEETMSKSFHKSEKLIEHTVTQGNIHEPESGSAYSIGEDLWRQLKRIQLPVFTGDKRSYRNWKAAFMACVETAPSTGEYKLLQLR